MILEGRLPSVTLCGQNAEDSSEVLCSAALRTPSPATTAAGVIGLIIDAHQHTWEVSRTGYSWIEPESPLNRDFGSDAAAEARQGTNVSGVVLVQAADTYADTEFMVATARVAPEVLGVVGWAPLGKPDEVREVLSAYSTSEVIKGVRCLSHDYPDAAWILKPEVVESLRIAGELDLTFDYVARSVDQLRLLARAAAAVPNLVVVLDHLGSPPVRTGPFEPWAQAINDLAQLPNVNVKLSGLTTLSGGVSFADRWAPWIDHALDRFGSARIMAGSDWPVSTDGAPFVDLWAAQAASIQRLPEAEVADVLGGVATRIYSLATRDGRSGRERNTTRAITVQHPSRLTH